MEKSSFCDELAFFGGELAENNDVRPVHNVLPAIITN